MTQLSSDCLPTDARSGVPIIRGPARVLTGAGMHHKIEFFGTKQVRYQLDNQTALMIKWDVASVRRMQGNKVVYEERQSYIEYRNGKRTELVLQGIVTLQCAMDDVEMRALGGPTRETRPVDEFKFYGTDEHP